jgi:nitrate/nitrite transporter NarK
VLAFVAGWLVSNVGAVAGPMADAYGVSLAFVGALTAAAVATHAVMQIPSGRLVDRYGARAVAIAGLSILVAADGVGALAAEPALAVMARLAVGVGTALCFVSGSDLLRAQRARVLAQGLYGGAAMAAAGLALALLPQLGRDVAWRVSWLSAAVLAAFGLVVVALSAARARARPPVRPAGAHPASVVRDPRLQRIGLVYAASYGSSVLVGTWIVTFLERGPHYSAAEAGAAGALTLFGGTVSRPFGGWIAERRPRLARPAIAAGLLAGAAGTAVLTLGPPLAVGVVAAAAVGIGAGVPFGPVFSGAQQLRPDRPAAAVGFVNFLANVVIVVGVPLIGLTFSLPGDGRVGLIVIACAWAAALSLLRPAAVLAPARAPAGRAVGDVGAHR